MKVEVTFTPADGRVVKKSIYMRAGCKLAEVISWWHRFETPIPDRHTVTFDGETVRPHEEGGSKYTIVRNNHAVAISAE